MAPPQPRSVPDHVRAELMRQMMENPRAVQELAQGMGVDMGRFGQRRNNSALLEDHAKTMREQQAMKLDSGLYTVEVPLPSMATQKSARDFRCPPALDACLPVSIATLQLDTTHRGRVLRGSVAVSEPSVMQGIMLLLEDENSDLVRVGLYNMIPGGTWLERFKSASCMFPKGRHLAILEPYYKVMGDGLHGVRVDNPAEVVFLDSLGPLDMAGYQDEGNVLFKGNHYEDAAVSYGRALQNLVNSSSSKGLIISLLLNSSACHLALQQLSLSLKLAFTAAVLDSTNSKAFFRTALALDALQLHGAANWCMKKAAAASSEGAKGSTSNSIPEQELMRKLSQAAVAATATADQALSDICSALLTLDAQWLPHGGASSAERVDGSSRLACPSSVDAGANSASNQFAGNTVQNAAAEADAANVVKDQGNFLYKAGSFVEALSCYATALSSLRQDRKSAATLLNNRAACHLRVGHLPSAVHDSSAALVLDPTQPKGYHRLGSALMQMERLSDAQACINAGLAVAPGNEGLAELQQRISIAVSASSTKTTGKSSSPNKSNRNSSGSGSGSGSASQHANLPKAPPPSSQPQMSGAAMSKMNNMMGMMASMPGFNKEEARKMGLPETGSLDNRVPPLHTEFSMAGMWPAQCDIPKSREALLQLYESARGMPMHDMTVMSTELKDEAPEDVIKRVGSNGTQDLHWLFNAPIGDIRSAARTEYASNTGHILHSFSNVPARKETFDAGTTHVAVGFLDLGNLCAALQAWPTDTTSQTSRARVSNTKPLRWVGFDMSSYCVAKTMVISKMVAMGAQVDAILQVWYSSAWSTNTLDAFRKALTAVLTESVSSRNRRSSSLPSDVQALLQHWQVTDVPLAVSRTQWLDSQKRTHVWIAGFKRQVDRLALCSYLITGQLLEADVGSVVMFGLPPGFGTRAEDEIFLQTIFFQDLMGELNKRKSLDVVAVAVNILRERISCLQTWMAAGRVSVEVHLGNMQPSNTELLSRIRGLKPWTMSWSNVPDYFQPAKFHKMARACSASEDTIHYLHSMNWVRDVKGACFMDHKAGRTRDVWQKVLAGFLKMAREEVLPMTSKYFGWEDYLLCPPVDNPRNIIDLILAGRYYQDWVAHFFQGEMQNYDNQVIVVQPPIYSAASRATSTIHVTFTYDKSVNFVTAKENHRM